jgi:hypothetical protein
VIRTSTSRRINTGIWLSAMTLKRVEAKAWDFRSRSAFLTFAGVTFVEWTQHLPEAQHVAFATDVLDRYQQVAADVPGEENLFRFYQMDITLSPRQNRSRSLVV